MSKILVTGATGAIGRRLVHTLADGGHRPTVLLRSPGRGCALGTDLDRVTTAVGDYAEPASLRAALDGVDRVFLVCPNGPEQVRHECAVLDAAREAGVSGVVKVSAHGASHESPVAFWRWHAEIEDHLERSGVPGVALRPTFSMANVLGHAEGVRRGGVLFAPAVQAPIAMVDPQDVADVAASFLTAPTMPPGLSRLDVSGPVGVTFGELAQVLSRLSGQPVRYQPGTDDEARVYMEQHGTPPFVIEQILAVFAALRAGNQARPVDAVRAILDREAGPLAEFLSDHADVFRVTAPA